MPKVGFEYVVAHPAGAASAVKSLFRKEVQAALREDLSYVPSAEMEWSVEAEPTAEGSSLEAWFNDGLGDHNMSAELAAHRVRWHLRNRHPHVAQALERRDAKPTRPVPDSVRFCELKQPNGGFLLALVQSDRLLCDGSRTYPLPDPLPAACQCFGCGETLDGQIAMLAFELDAIDDATERFDRALSNPDCADKRSEFADLRKRLLREAAAASPEHVLAQLESGSAPLAVVDRWLQTAGDGVRTAGIKRLDASRMLALAFGNLSRGHADGFRSLSGCAPLSLSQNTLVDLQRWLTDRDPNKSFDTGVIELLKGCSDEAGPVIERYGASTKAATKIVKHWRAKTWYGVWLVEQDGEPDSAGQWGSWCEQVLADPDAGYKGTARCSVAKQLSKATDQERERAFLELVNYLSEAVTPKMDEAQARQLSPTHRRVGAFAEWMVNHFKQRFSEAACETLLPQLDRWAQQRWSCVAKPGSDLGSAVLHSLEALRGGGALAEGILDAADKFAEHVPGYAKDNWSDLRTKPTAAYALRGLRGGSPMTDALLAYVTASPDAEALRAALNQLPTWLGDKVSKKDHKRLTEAMADHIDALASAWLGWIPLDDNLAGFDRDWLIGLVYVLGSADGPTGSKALASLFRHPGLLKLIRDRLVSRGKASDLGELVAEHRRHDGRLGQEDAARDLARGIKKLGG